MSAPSKTLLNSASVFLEESLRSFNARSLMFAILHVTTAVELILKERLAQIHPNLIFKNLDKETLDRSKTVGLSELPLRLSHLGVQISSNELQTIREVARWRNEIVHHTPTYDEKIIIAKLGEIYNFLATFLVKQLNVRLERVISQKLYKTAAVLLDEWKNVVRAAQLRAIESRQTILRAVCPTCGTSRVLTKAKGRVVTCHLCAKTLFCGTCPLCHEEAIGEVIEKTMASFTTTACRATPRIYRKEFRAGRYPLASDFTTISSSSDFDL